VPSRVSEAIASALMLRSWHRADNLAKACRPRAKNIVSRICGVKSKSVSVLASNDSHLWPSRIGGSAHQLSQESKLSAAPAGEAVDAYRMLI